MEQLAGATLVRPDEEGLSETDDAAVTQHRRQRTSPPQHKNPDTEISRRGLRLRCLFSEGGLAFLIPCALYVSVGVLLDFRYKSFNGDAVSRMANGFYVLYSGTPHLAAVGFVWNPGTSIADLVPLLFYHLWTPLASHMFAASIVSSSAWRVGLPGPLRTLDEWGVPRPRAGPHDDPRP